MSREQRKKSRRPLHSEARIFIDGETPQIPCWVKDVSESGARLDLKDERSQLPPTFTLLLGPNGLPRRECAVVRQDGLSLGVIFLIAKPTQ
jgi:PilZ domain